jgi:hypothetical protein
MRFTDRLDTDVVELLRAVSKPIGGWIFGALAVVLGWYSYRHPEELSGPYYESFFAVMAVLAFGYGVLQVKQYLTDYSYRTPTWGN